jgi:hypothetical protein
MKNEQGQKQSIRYIRAVIVRDPNGFISFCMIRLSILPESGLLESLYTFGRKTRPSISPTKEFRRGTVDDARIPAAQKDY